MHFVRLKKRFSLSYHIHYKFQIVYQQISFLEAGNILSNCWTIYLNSKDLEAIKGLQLIHSSRNIVKYCCSKVLGNSITVLHIEYVFRWAFILVIIPIVVSYKIRWVIFHESLFQNISSIANLFTSCKSLFGRF